MSVFARLQCSSRTRHAEYLPTLLLDLDEYYKMTGSMHEPMAKSDELLKDSLGPLQHV
jgi:hypothetical protein